jgi:hypothetical protein
MKDNFEDVGVDGRIILKTGYENFNPVQDGVPWQEVVGPWN